VEEVGQLRDTAARSATALSDARFRAYTLEEKLAALEKSAEATYAERLLLAVKVRPGPSHALVCTPYGFLSNVVFPITPGNFLE
jgi:hypothetical protein